MSESRSQINVLFLTHYFPPEVGAPQSRLFELAKHLTATGLRVTVVTGFPNYPTGVIAPEYRGRLAMEENLSGVRVLRTWVYATPNRGFLKRILNHLSFALSSLTALPKVGRVDVIFVESPPLFIGLAALAYSRFTRAPFVFNVSDIWPQSAVELGALTNPLAIRLSEMLEMHLYRRAARVSLVTPGMVERLAARGVPREKLFLLTNGVDTSTFRPAQVDAALAQSLDLNGRKVFLYAGTHGMAQGLAVILDAAQQTTNPDVLYVLAGEGAEKEALVARAESQGIGNVRFLPNQPRSAIPGLLNLAYAAIIPLKRLDLFKSALPSKMFEAMATSRPIVAAMWGEAATLVGQADCGVVVEPEDPAALKQAVERLAGDPELARRLGENGRDYAIEHFDRQTIAERLLGLLRDAAASPWAPAPFPVGFASSVAALSLLAWLPVVAGYQSRTRYAWGAAVVLSLVIGLARPRTAALVGALAVTSSLVSSGLVTDETRYIPVLVMGGAVTINAALDMWARRRLFAPPPASLVAAAGFYLLWAALATLKSIDHRVSVQYLFGMVLFFTLAFWAIPRMLDSRRERELVLGAIGGIGAAIALSIYVGSVLGPKTVFGRIVGDYLTADITVAGGHATGLQFGRSAGVYLAPFEPGVLMAISLVALVALATAQVGRARWASIAALVFVAPAEILTLDRSAWLAVAGGAAVYAVGAAIAGLRFRTAAIVAGIFAVLLFVVLTNIAGVNGVSVQCAIPVPAGGTCPDWARQQTEANLRGGAALTGRQYLWSASFSAVKAHPIFGYGPGNDVTAIQPYLHGVGLIYKGLTSHSTWLRTAVEMGVPGLLFAVAILVVGAWQFAVRFFTGRADARDPVQLSFAATVAGLVPAMTFESFLLGGITFPNLYPALAIGLLLAPPVLLASRNQARQPVEHQPEVGHSRQQEVDGAEARVADHPAEVDPQRRGVRDR